MKRPGEVKALNTEDLEPIGEGGNSRVFRLDGNKVVKVFHKDFPRDMVYYEYDRSCEAYAAGVNCAACYGMVPGICFP